jgi:signal transduction histidine kinase/DNA-binding response OmpR family regulator
VNATMHRASRGIDQAEIRFLVDKNADGIIVVDDAGTVLFANPAAEEIFGRPADLLVGSPIGIPLLTEDTTEITVHRPGGDQIDAEIRVVGTTWDRRPARLATLRDVSARKLMEERLRHAAKMEAIGRLTAGIAHDFNNLLTVVLGNLETAQRRTTLAQSARERALHNATRGARRAAVLTERLLAFARRKPLEPHALDVNEVVSGMSDLLQRTLGENIEIRTALSSNPWLIEADPIELEAAILNMAVNARDAMPDGGRLVVETANVELDATYAAANPDVAPGPYVRISVADSGTGMTADVLRKVFEPFFTTKPDGRGTGLGLSQVYGFVKQSGGHIKLYSEPMIGTTAHLYFPKTEEGFSAAHRYASEAKPVDEIPVSRAGESILVVEDDEDVRNFTVNSLRELGYVVTEAVDAESGLEILDREPGVQLLFTDLGLPGGIDGRVLAKRAQQMRPSLKVLITTAYAGSALMREGRLDPEVELLSKPFSLASLATRIRELLDRRPATEDARILVVDDEVLLRMLVVDILAGSGLQAEEAGTFHEALTTLRDGGDRFVAAIVDLGLPDRSGGELVTEIRALRPQLPIILASGQMGDDVRQRYAHDARLQILVKPFDPEALLAALARFGVGKSD